ncbi:peptidyl-prolyl cis-trans isomerase FKBP53-like [Salvia splendens]|uniref:peptidyl-prolyl cis-trans isomerase FKBP53-like n=1 Tax=Salvia splendens TaxID=180675 RepID=UPI001C27AD26|nr:peptidyl-prolyl cis-trans isomerase FKBP53-like [Salvia splendens]
MVAFKGIEVKPGEPYILSDEERGRLHVTQATLGSGASTKKSILQCEVGDKKPIYLCSLLPDRLETCPLNLEFEEDEKVTFSIIGPQSVHLCGFFYGDESDDEDESDEDGYGCNLYEGDAMGIGCEDEVGFDYDSENEDYSEDDLCCEYPQSPVRNSGVKIEERVDEGKPSDENGISKRGNIILGQRTLPKYHFRSVNFENLILGPFVKVRRPKMMFPLSKKAKKKKKKTVGNENVNSQTVPKAGTSVSVLESEDEDGFPVHACDKKSEANLEKTAHESSPKKSQNKIEKADANLKRKSGAGDQDEQPASEIEPHSSSAQPDTTQTKKQNKNKKKKVVEKLDSSLENRKQSKVQENAQIPSAGKVVDKNETELEKQENGGASKSLQVRTFSNGLVIEELAMGRPNGKRASPGKKVSVHYIGKLQKNGKIFDSNVRKFVSIGLVIKGWDVGVNARMRVGDKRRLTIPPAMGYGPKGCPPAIPHNSWLVFDVELVDAN